MKEFKWIDVPNSICFFNLNGFTFSEPLSIGENKRVLFRSMAITAYLCKALKIAQTESKRSVIKQQKIRLGFSLWEYSVAVLFSENKWDCKFFVNGDLVITSDSLHAFYQRIVVFVNDQGEN